MAKFLDYLHKQVKTFVHIFENVLLISALKFDGFLSDNHQSINCCLFFTQVKTANKHTSLAFGTTKKER